MNASTFILQHKCNFICFVDLVALRHPMERLYQALISLRTLNHFIFLVRKSGIQCNDVSAFGFHKRQLYK